MYAIDHAATALILKKRYPTAPMIWLLISVQAIELLWVLLNYLGVEYFTVDHSVLHLGHIIWSHSVASTVFLAVAAWLVTGTIFKNPKLGTALGLGIISHIILDIAMHEQDIQLSPFSPLPVLGFNIQGIPLMAILVETAYGIGCWWYFGGGRPLLVAIVILNLANIPTMFNLTPGVIDTISTMHFLLPTFILAQILISWCCVWRFSRTSEELSELEK